MLIPQGCYLFSPHPSESLLPPGRTPRRWPCCISSTARDRPGTGHDTLTEIPTDVNSKVHSTNQTLKRKSCTRTYISLVPQPANLCHLLPHQNGPSSSQARRHLISLPRSRLSRTRTRKQPPNHSSAHQGTVRGGGERGVHQGKSIFVIHFGFAVRSPQAPPPGRCGNQTTTGHAPAPPPYAPTIPSCRGTLPLLENIFIEQA